MPSVIIAAHNEATVIDRCLSALTAEGGEALEITVAANGCTDDTVARARRHEGVRVLDLPSPGKAAALNAADAVTRGFPRVYLDADVVLSTGAVGALCASLGSGTHVAVPRRELVLAGRPWPVRAYYAVNAALPAHERGLFGRGAIAVSGEGRGRFDAFPDMVADDLFLDSVFSDSEKRQVDAATSVVETPLRTRDLYRRLVRVRSGNRAMRRAAGTGAVPHQVRPADPWAWLRVVLADPRLLPSAPAYAAITAAATLGARRRRVGWGQDRSSRLTSGAEA